jgi:hypothetical protein
VLALSVGNSETTSVENSQHRGRRARCAAPVEGLYLRFIEEPWALGMHLERLSGGLTEGRTNQTEVW